MMPPDDRLRQRGDRLDQLTRTGADSAMGQLLRRFWQPVAVATEVAAGATLPVRVLGEELVLYRGEGGRPFLLANECAHRLTLLHTGWVEGDQLRCMYHGWRYDGSGRCTQRPAERDDGPPNVRIAGYPCEEYAGLIFAYLGAGEPPAFDLPRKEVFERPVVMIARRQVWNVNWLQTVENSLDAVHVSFVHNYEKQGKFIERVTSAIPELDYYETSAGIRQIATRGADNVRISDWTFPNNNRISVPGLADGDPWIDIAVWMVPVDDEHTARLSLYASPSSTPECDARVRAYFDGCTNYNAADHHDDLIYRRIMPNDPLIELTNAQDYIAQRGQGVIVDRARETLGRSDRGIAFLRRLLFREIEAIEAGRPTKVWHRLEVAAELPEQRATV